MYVLQARNVIGTQALIMGRMVLDMMQTGWSAPKADDSANQVGELMRGSGRLDLAVHHDGVQVVKLGEQILVLKPWRCQCTTVIYPEIPAIPHALRSSSC